MRFNEINLFGIYVAPMSVMLVAAWMVTIYQLCLGLRRQILNDCLFLGTGNADGAVSTGLLPASKKSSTPADANWSSGFGGAHAVSPADASVDEAPRSGALETAKLLGGALPN